MNRIKRGMQLPLAGAPEQVIAAGVQAPRSLAILGEDYVGMKPTMLVAEGDRVKLGQPLFSDKKNPEVIYTLHPDLVWSVRSIEAISGVYFLLS